MKYMKRIICLVLTVCLIATLAPAECMATTKAEPLADEQVKDLSGDEQTGTDSEAVTAGDTVVVEDTVTIEDTAAEKSEAVKEDKAADIIPGGWVDPQEDSHGKKQYEYNSDWETGENETAAGEELSWLDPPVVDVPPEILIPEEAPEEVLPIELGEDTYEEEPEDDVEEAEDEYVEEEYDAYTDATETYEYTLSGEDATITGYKGSETNIVIPDTVDGYSVTAIGTAFRNNKTITSITLLDPLTSINSYAFSGCAALTTVTLPDGLTTIGSNAFQNCAKLATITIPAGVTVLNSYLFSGCSELATVTLPDGLTTIGSYAFQNCAALKEITIPATVKSISSNAFAGSVKTITFADGTETIPENACNGATKLTKVVFPASGVTSIGASAFRGCTSLTAIVIPTDVTEIKSYMFYGCTNLATVTLPDKLTTIGSYAFYGCTNLATIALPDELTTIGSNAFQNCAALTAITIPATVTSIGSNAFAGSVKTITFAAGTETIPGSACYGANNLTTVNFPTTGVTSIGESAFRGCSALTSIDIPVGVTALSAYLFYDCKNLTTLSLPVGLTTIGSNAFQNCAALTAITIPATVTSIGSNAFAGSVQTITFAAGTETIPENACYGAKNLTTVNFPTTGITSIGASAFRGCTSLTGIDIPTGVTELGNYVFYDCSKLASVGLSEGLTTIGARAFYNCTALTAITLPSTVTTISTDNVFYNAIQTIAFAEGTKAVPENACYGANKLETITFPTSVVSIGENAFRACKKLATITLSDSITDVGKYAFADCTVLTTADVKSAKTLGASAFYGCTALEEVTLSPALDSIETSVFYNCKKLADLTLGANITSIGESAFYNCVLLEKLTIPKSVVSIGKNAFNNSVKEITFEAGMKTIPENACYGANVLTTVTIPTGVVTIGDYAFYGCTVLETLDIPEGVTKVGKQAFYNCSKLSVGVPTTLDVVEENAFYGCNIRGTCGADATWYLSIADGLMTIKGTGTVSFAGKPSWSKFTADIKYLVVENGITSICAGAFSGCTSMKTVTLGDSVESIGEEAFKDCSNLERVEFSENLKKIGDRAFNGCDNIDSVIYVGDPPTFGEDAMPDTQYTAYYPQSSGDWTPAIMNQEEFQWVEWSQWDDTLPTRDIVLTLDISGSMSGKRITALKEAVIEFANTMGGRITNTRLAVVSFASDSRMILDYTTDIVRLKDCISGLSAGGGTYYLKAFAETEQVLQSTEADIKTIIIFSDGEPSDSTSSIRTKAAALRNDCFIYCVGLDPSSSNMQLMIDIAGSEDNYFRADDVSQLAELFVQVSENLGKGNNTSVTLVRNKESINLRKKEYEIEQGSDTEVDINVTAYWGSHVPGEVRLTQGGKTILSNANGKFTAIQPGKLFEPRTTIYATLVDSSNVIVAMIRTKLSISASTSSRLDADTKTTKVTVYYNKKDSSDRNDKYELCEKANITIGSQSYTTDKNGNASIPTPESGSITISKDGYISRTITAVQLATSADIYLQPVSKGCPVVYGVWVGTADVLTHSFNIGILSESKLTFMAEVSWGSSTAGSISLVQNNKSVKFDGNNLTTVLSDNFDVSDTVYIVAKDAAGKSTKKALKLAGGTSSDVVNGFNGAKLNFTSSVSVTIPNTVALEIFRGLKVSAKISTPIPVTMSVKDGKIYGAIGVDLKKYDSSRKKDGEEVRTFTQQFKDILREPKKSFKALKNLREEYKKAIDPAEAHWVFKANISVLGFVEGVYDNTGKITWLDGGVLANPSVSFGKSFPFAFLGAPMYFNTEFVADIMAQLNVRFNERAKNFTPNGEIKGDMSASGGLGLGLKKVLYAEGGLKGTLSPDWKINFFDTDYFKLTGTISAYAKVGLLFLEASYSSKPFVNKVLVEYPSGKMADYSVDTATFYDSGIYKPKDLSYLNKGSSFHGYSMRTFAAQNEGSAQTPTSIKENIYKQAEPQIVTLADDTLLAVWVDGTSSDVNGLCLYYSYCKNGTWSTPAEVAADGTADYAPQLNMVGDKAFLTWQNATKKFDIQTENTLDAIAPYFDIAAAVYDPDTATFSVTNFNYEHLDMLPEVGGTPEETYIVWVNNSGDSWFGEGRVNSIIYSKYEEGSWTEPKVFDNRLYSIGSLSVCYNNGLKVAFSMDADGNVETTEDSYIYVNGRRLTSSELLESSPRYAGTTLFWNSDGKLLYNGGGEDGMSFATDKYELVDVGGKLAMIYVEPKELSSVLKLAYFNEAENAWTAAVTLADDGTYIGSFSACALSDGTLNVLYTSQVVTGALKEGEEITDSPYGTASLKHIGIQPYYNITLDDVTYVGDTYCAGNQMELDLEITNNGLETADNIRIQVLDEQDAELTTIYYDKPIVPGDTERTSTYFTTDTPEKMQKVKVTITPVDMTDPENPADITDADPKDNTKEVVLAYEDICLERLTFGYRTGDAEDDEDGVIMANVVNRGYHTQSNMTVSLIEGSMEGTVVETKTITSLDPLDVEPVLFEDNLKSDTVYYVSVSEVPEENNVSNNSDFVVTSILKESTVQIDDIRTDGIDIYLQDNPAGVCYVALYDADNKMFKVSINEVTADAGALTVAYEDVKLNEFTVKVFVLDDNLKPLCNQYSTVVKK